MNMKRVMFVQLILVVTALAESQKAKNVRLSWSPLVAETTTETTLQLATSRRRHRRLEEDDGDVNQKAETADFDSTQTGGDAGDETDPDGEGGQVIADPQTEGEAPSGNEPTGNEGNGSVQSEPGKGTDTTPADGSTVSKEGETTKCGSASDCSKCVDVSTALLKESDEKKACEWKLDISDALSCVEVPGEDAMPGDRCSEKSEDVGNEAQTPEDTSPPAPEDAEGNGGDVGGDEDDEGGGGGFFLGLVLLALIGGAVCFVWKKLMSGRGMPKMKDIMDGSDLQSVFTTSGSSVVRSGAKYENVPLTSDDDEEWGWEDGGESNGDIELPKKEETIPDFGRPLSNNSTSSRNGTTRLQPPMTKSSPVTSRPTRTIPTSTASDWSEPTRPPVAPMSSPSMSPTLSTASPPSSGNMPAVMPMKITSLGASSRPGGVTKKKKPPSKPEDDLFASMGLSAKPSFSAAKAATTKPVAAPVPSWKAADSNISASAADWDDADLDDLLDD